MTDTSLPQGNENVDTKSEEDEDLPEDYDGPYKMVFVVNMELGMGVGKIAAQVNLEMQL